MNRFYASAEPVPVEGGYGIALDGRPIKTPRQRLLAVPTDALACLIAEEWATQGDEIRPAEMVATGLANAAIDVIAPDPATMIASLAGYGETDLLCYRADERALAAEQARLWQPLLDWAEDRWGIAFATNTGVMHVAQPAATVAALKGAVAALDPFRLAALSPLVTIGGSLVVALALVEGAVSVDAGWDAVTLDDRWQEDRWGEDAEATKARERRHREWLAAARFLAALDQA